jgi:hypothetical protein
MLNVCAGTDDTQSTTANTTHPIRTQISLKTLPINIRTQVLSAAADIHCPRLLDLIKAVLFPIWKGGYFSAFSTVSRCERGIWNIPNLGFPNWEVTRPKFLGYMSLSVSGSEIFCHSEVSQLSTVEDRLFFTGFTRLNLIRLY